MNGTIVAIGMVTGNLLLLSTDYFKRYDSSICVLPPPAPDSSNNDYPQTCHSIYHAHLTMSPADLKIVLWKCKRNRFVLSLSSTIFPTLHIDTQLLASHQARISIHNSFRVCCNVVEHTNPIKLSIDDSNFHSLACHAAFIQRSR